MKVIYRGKIHAVNFPCDMFQKLENEFEELNLEMYEDLFLDLNCDREVFSLLEKYDVIYLVQGLVYFGASHILEKLSTFLQGKKIIDFLERHMEEISWPSLCSNSSISFEFFEKYAEDIKIPIKENCPVTHLFFSHYNVKLEKDYIIFPSKIVWDNILHHQNMSVKFLEKYWEKFSQSALRYLYSFCSKEEILEHLIKKKIFPTCSFWVKENVSFSFIQKYANI